MIFVLGVVGNRTGLLCKVKLFSCTVWHLRDMTVLYNEGVVRLHKVVPVYLSINLGVDIFEELDNCIS